MCLCVFLCLYVCVTVAWGERPAVSTAPQAAPSDRPSDSRLRHRYALALEAAARLANLNRIDLATRGRLKELILDNDANIMAAVEVFEFDHDADEVCWVGVCVVVRCPNLTPAYSTDAGHVPSHRRSSVGIACLECCVGGCRVAEEGDIS